MVDSMSYHVQAWQTLLAKLDLELSIAEILPKLYGTNPEVIRRFFGEDHFSVAEIEEYAAFKEALYRELYTPDLQLVKGLSQFLAKSHEAGIRMAIGTSGTPENVDFVLDGCDIRSYFQVIVTANEVKEGKPHPETFLLCAEKLGVAPSECLVFEDVPKGAEAAERAGMACVIITTHHSPSAFQGISVQQFIQTFEKI